MRKSLIFWLCCVALTAIVTDSMAQDRPGGGRGGRGGGRTMTRMAMLRMEPVQTELDLSDEQKEEITGILAEILPARGGGAGGAGGAGGGAGGGERPQISPEAIKEAETKVMGLLEAKQKTRLNEIFVQVSGARALLDDAIAKELKLSDDAKEEIKGEIDSQSAKMREIFEANAEDREAAMAKIQEARAESDKTIFGLLSDTQKEAFEKMKGEKFDMPMGGFGGGRGGGGGAARGGEGGRPQRPGSGGEKGGEKGGDKGGDGKDGKGGF